MSLENKNILLKKHEKKVKNHRLCKMFRKDKDKEK